MSIICLVTIFCAGNACVLKLSEIAVATSNVLADLIPKYLDNVSCYFVLPTTVLEYMLMSVALDYPHELTRTCFSIEHPGIITQHCQGRNARVVMPGS